MKERVHRRRWRKNQRQRSSRLLGGQTQFNSILCCASCFALVVLEEWIHPFSFKSTKASVQAWQGIENILSPNQMRRPLPLLLSPSFFSERRSPCLGTVVFWFCVRIRAISRAQGHLRDRSVTPGGQHVLGGLFEGHHEAQQPRISRHNWTILKFKVPNFC